MKLRYSQKIRKTARQHYVVGGLTFDEIAQIPDMPSERQIRRWCETENWADMLPTLTSEQAIAKRICLLADKDDKTDKDFKELDFLVKKQCELNQSSISNKAKPAAALANVACESGNNEHEEKKGKRKKRKKNDCSSITVEMLDELKDELLYDHQKVWFHNQDHRSRFILKSRQIGATFYFSFEAFYDALVNNRNKVFISASREQAEIFKANIIALCREKFNIELSGNPLQLIYNNSSPTLYFKSTNSRTAQSASGDLYIDEVFWIPKFKELRSVAQAMATHAQYRITYFSTPSVTSHEAYDLWNGKWFRKTMACNDPEFDIDVSHKKLKNGCMCEDGIWRQMVTVNDAVEQGFDRIDVEQLKREYAQEDFNNLFLCKFIDDAHSAFNLKKLLACQVDREKWKDFDLTWPRPYAMKPALIGFDPARSIDKARVVVISAPSAGEKFRLLESHDLSGNDFEAMADFIKDLTRRYNVVHIGVDTTGIGLGVFELIEKFFPLAMPLHYNPMLKNKLVIKAINVIDHGRFEFDNTNPTVAASFMNIRKKVVGDQITYAANRTASTGHADEAWAIMHALIYEPLYVDTSNEQTTIEFAA